MTAAPADPRPLPLAVAWVSLLVYGLASLIERPAAAGVAGLALLVLMLSHATAGHGWRATALFAAIAFGVALAAENLSIATGVPFGYFSHTDAFGTKIGAVPAVVALGYFLYGYPAWLLATLIAAGGRTRPILLPLVAAFIVTQFDLAYDPIGATVQGLWHYRHPSGFNGVPLSNFVGWLVTTTVIFGGWRAVERERTPPPASNIRYWAVPVLFWLVTAARFPLLLAAAPADGRRAGGTALAVADVYASATIVALIVLGFTIALATSRLLEARASAPTPSSS